MLQSNVDSLKKTVNALIKRRVPPDSVMILHKHAIYLGCQFWSNTVPVNEVTPSGLHVPMETKWLVSVKLFDLYNSLKVATGVEYQELKISKPEVQAESGGSREPKTKDDTVDGKTSSAV